MRVDGAARPKRLLSPPVRLLFGPQLDSPSFCFWPQPALSRMLIWSSEDVRYCESGRLNL